MFSVFFPFFCLSALVFRMFFLPFICFFLFFFDLYLRELSPMMSNKQTNKKIQSYQLALHSLREVFGDGMESYRPNSWMNTEGRRRKKVNKVHEGGESSKKFKKTEDGCAADGA